MPLAPLSRELPPGPCLNTGLRGVGRRRIDVVSSVPRPGTPGGIHIGAWIECDDGSLFRFSTVPAGMTIEEAERIVSSDAVKKSLSKKEPAEGWPKT